MTVTIKTYNVSSESLPWVAEAFDESSSCIARSFGISEIDVKTRIEDIVKNTTINTMVSEYTITT